MANLNYNDLANKLRLCLAKMVSPASDKSEEDYRIFGGNESQVTMSVAGSPAMHLIADPTANIGMSFSLSGAGLDTYNDLVEGMSSNQTIQSKVSRSAIEAEVERLLRLFRSKTAFVDGDLIAALKASVTHLIGLVRAWDTVVPVDNLEMVGIEEFTVGRVKFRPTSLLMSNVLGDANQHIDLTKSPNDSKLNSKQQMWTLIATNFGATPTCATLIVEAEENRLSTLADDEVDAALNLLRCYTTLFFPPGYRNYIGLRGDVNSLYRPCIGKSTDGNHWKYSMQAVGALYPYRIDAQFIANLQTDYAFALVSAALAKDVPNKFEQVIRVTSRWLGRGVVAHESAEKVLNLSIALERLLCGDKKENITDTLAQRIAFLLGSSTESRTHLYKRMKKLYDLRSKVVHEGNTNAASEDLSELEMYACNAFVAMSQRLSEWTDPIEFYAWAQQQMFAVPGPSGSSEEELIDD